MFPLDVISQGRRVLRVAPPPFSGLESGLQDANDYHSE